MIETRYSMLVARKKDREPKSRSRWITPAISLAIFLSLVLATQAWAVSSIELVERAKRYDGKRVEYQGEVIGDVMKRGDYAWIHVNDDFYSTFESEDVKILKGYNSGHAVWCRADDVEFIEHLGDHKHQGDYIKIVGVFNQACTEHGGTMDIHATRIELMKQGFARDYPFNSSRVLVAVFLLVLSALLFFLNRMRKKQKSETEAN